MSATVKIAPIGCTTPGRHALVMAGVAMGAIMALTPFPGHAQDLERLFNRAAETQAQNADVDAGAEAPVDDADSWGLDIQGPEGNRPTPSTDTSIQVDLDAPAPEAAAQQTWTLPELAGSGTAAPLRTELEEQIDARMRAITQSLGKAIDSPVSETLTVEELDTIQRNAQRAAAAQTLKDAEYEAIRGEIDMLLYLQNTLTELQQARNEQPQGGAAQPQAEQATAAPEVDVEALRAQWEAEQAAEAVTREQEALNAALAAEQASIPRLAAVKGAAGAWSAEIESVRGVMQFVEPGDALADGFILESIDGKGAVIKAGGSGNRYSLIPSPPADPNATPAEFPLARDLSQGGGVF